MFGAITADIISSRCRFEPTRDYNFELLTEKNCFSEGTVYTIAIADALLHGRDFDESIQDWFNRYPSQHNPSNKAILIGLIPVAHWFEHKNQVLDTAEAILSDKFDKNEVRAAQTILLAIYTAMKFNRTGYQNAALHIDEIINKCVKFSGYDIKISKASAIEQCNGAMQDIVRIALKIINMSKNFVDAVRLAVSLGANTDILGSIVGGMAETIWGIHRELRSQIMEYFPTEMYFVIDNFHRSRYRSFKSLIDTTFYRKDYSEAAWDMLDEGEREDLLHIVDEDKEKGRKLMAERAKAREQW